MGTQKDIHHDILNNHMTYFLDIRKDIHHHILNNHIVGCLKFYILFMIKQNTNNGIYIVSETTSFVRSFKNLESVNGR